MPSLPFKTSTPRIYITHRCDRCRVTGSTAKRDHTSFAKHANLDPFIACIFNTPCCTEPKLTTLTWETASRVCKYQIEYHFRVPTPNLERQEQACAFFQMKYSRCFLDYPPLHCQSPKVLHVPIVICSYELQKRSYSVL